MTHQEVEPMQRVAPRRKGSAWEFLVPDPAKPGRYLSRSFKNRSSGERWQFDSYAALADGTSLPDASLYRASELAQKAAGAIRPVLTVGDVAREWWRCEYVDEPMSSPSRKTSTEAHVRLHIAEFFDSRIRDIAHLDHDLCVAFRRHLAGNDLPLADRPAEAPVVAVDLLLSPSQAAEAYDVNLSVIKRGLSSGRFPNHTRVVVNGKTAHGSIRIPTSDLVAAGLGRPADARESRRVRRGLSKSYSQEILFTLARVLKFARSRRYIDHNPLEGVTAKAPRPAVARKAPNRSRPRALTLAECKQIAGHLHVHHQTVLWLQRVLGLRISEAFGLHISDFADYGEVGLVVIGRQGGRLFRVRDDNGDIIDVDEHDQLKTSQSFRVLAVPGPLLTYLRDYVAEHHRNRLTGDVDPDARLVKGLRNSNRAGQSAFREAYMRACADTGLDYKSLGFHVDTQHLRKSLGAELHWYTDVPEHVRSRVLGHRLQAHGGGAPMTSISYTPEMQDLQPFLQVAKDLGRRIESEIEDLVAPEVERPIHGNAMLELPEGLVAVAASDQPLPTDTPPGIIEGAELTVDDAAALLGVQPRTVRRRIRRKTLPARRALDHNGRLVQVVSAEAVDREPQPDAGHLTLSEAAERLGLGYATLYQRAAVGTLASHRDPDTGRLTVDRAEIERALADQDRESLIRERSVTLLEAAALADCGHSLIRYWLRTGRVRPDPDTQPDDITYVLRCDVEQAALELKAQRGQTGKRQPGTPDGLVPLPDAQRLTGHGRRQIQQLVATGDLVRRDYRKRFHVERESLDAYIARSAPS